MGIILEALGFAPTGKKLEIEPGLFYATFGGRLLASAVDSLLMLLVIAPILDPIAKATGYDPAQVLSGEKLEQMQVLVAQDRLFEGTLLLLSSMFTDLKWQINSIIQLLVLAAVVLIFWFARGATPGKMLLRMRIVDAATLGEPTRFQYVLRYLGYFVSVIPLMMGFFWVGIDKRKQGWHDKIARTLVVVDKRKPEEKVGNLS